MSVWADSAGVVPGAAASDEQLDVWLAEQRNTEPGRYHVPLVLQWSGKLDLTTLAVALDDVQWRHPALRTRFEVVDGDLIRRIAEAPEVTVVRRPMPEPYSADSASRAATELWTRPLDLSAAAFRADLLEYSGTTVMVLTLHHIVADGWSVEILARDLLDYYKARLDRPNEAGRPAGVTSVPSADPQTVSAAERYWADLLSPKRWRWMHPPPDLDPAGSGPGPSGGRWRPLTADGLAQLRGLSQHLRESPAVTVLAAWTLVLHAWSGADDGIVGTAFHGREDDHEEVGLFTRVLPIRSRWDAAQSFAEHAGGLRNQVLDAMGHAAIPAARLRAIRNDDGVSAGQVKIAFLHVTEPTMIWKFGATTVRVVRCLPDTAKYDLTLAAVEGTDSMSLWIDYDASRYRQDTIDHLLQQVETLLDEAGRDPELTCRQLLENLGQGDDPHQHGPSFTAVDQSDVVAHLAADSVGRMFAAECAREHGAGVLALGLPEASELRGLSSVLAQRGATVLFLPANLLGRVLAEEPALLQRVRQTRIFGAPVPRNQLNEAVSWSGPGGLWFGYTPYGTTVATVWEVTRQQEPTRRAVLGRQVPGAALKAWFGSTAHRCAVGVVGELSLAAAAPDAPPMPAVRLAATGLLELVEESASPVAVPGPTEPHQLGHSTADVLPVRLAWRDVLGDQSFGDDDNFFDVGGNSLLVLRLQQALKKRAGRSMTLADLFRHTTVRAQSRHGAESVGSSKIQELPGTRRRNQPDPSDADIAVIGMGCRFAGAADLAAFWDNLRLGRDCLTNAPGPTVTDLGAGATRVGRWGMLAEGPVFDAGLFGFSTADAADVDPRHGVLYECLWAAVEDAGLRMSDIGPRTSLYAGRDRWSESFDNGAEQPPARADDVVGRNATFLPSRFSYWADLQGESLLVDTGCSTSLVGVHLACRSLRQGDCDYALVGGASIEYPPDGSYVAWPGHIYSADGYCRPFDEAASGTVGGDGAGAVLLRRLGDARRDGDPVYAIIRGSAVNNDGRARVGYSAPGVDGQVRVIRRALEAARIAPDEVEFVEPHGTGTRLGDAIEATALVEALGPKGRTVAIGGLKASIGHTNSASGVAGLIKAVLAVHHGLLPATPHVRNPIGELRRGSRFTLLPESRPWHSQDRLRVAGVSSFGVGGTNAHVIVQQDALQDRQEAH
ncbi:beta-ketoacyl synthase N-terminal-like domain-containing protein [Micromonospora sp. NPDC050276]|uniref:beta-ketoacyl synthase N-terminal-like domain-containing protein n=1 Tax=Micromonospora sp. NPDC050276 TaxID=3364278 RepID=UPI00378DC342